jgi:hypothetical protein
MYAACITVPLTEGKGVECEQWLLGDDQCKARSLEHCKRGCAAPHRSPDSSPLMSVEAHRQGQPGTLAKGRTPRRAKLEDNLLHEGR